ncbi:HAD family acid phosphatase [Sphingosinithalassobacter sp. CS137]|uniref:HAD family acid phosphatase n=1 Tax=Sphingosinithalassobacter sp. CS137 TaxID=2762748 RepID=UPI0021CEAE57|nr:HAD family acid phosphatase [Sphingosinithalassobacter sp. CS137]
MRVWRFGLLLIGAPVLSGCVAAALPVLAGATVLRNQFSEGQDAPRRAEPTAQPGSAVRAEDLVGREFRTEDGQVVRIIGAGQLPPPDGAVPRAATAPAAARPAEVAVPGGMQFLYGSAEAAAISIQTYQALWRYVDDRVLDRLAGQDVASVVLASDATLERMTFVPCAGKPLAVVFDVDETVLLNTGYEADDARRGTGFDPDRWSRWEATGAGQVEAVPGAVETIEAMRRREVAVIFNSNRASANAEGTAAALRAAGLGEAVHGDTLWLKGDAPGGSAKDARRWAIAERYCVVAMVGDQLGDFSDLFNSGDAPPRIRRNLAAQTMIAPMWGTGWFLLPNPVYGAGVTGGYEEIFPPNLQWADPAEE